MKRLILKKLEYRQYSKLQKNYNRELSSRKRIAVFISIPKNASKTVLNILKLGANRDIDNADSPVIYENHQRGVVLASKYELENLFVFCFSRNPYDRCVSWYEFHKNIEPYKSLTFEKWIKKGMPHHWEKQNETNYIKENMSPLLQYNFVDQCKVDFIGKIENFENDLKTIVDKLNRIWVQSNFKKRFKYNNKNINKSKRNSNIDSYYTNETKEIVHTLLKKDFLYFGYKK